MPVYNNIKCVHIHIPKTGGQSITDMLNKAEVSHKNEEQFELDHLTTSMLLKRTKIESYFKFAIVRHPLDRLVSEYFFSKKYRPYLIDTTHYTFSEYVKSISELDIDSLSHNIANHLYTQTKFLYENDNLLVDYVGKFESIENSINYVSQQIGIKFPPLPHVNKSDKENIEFDSQTLTLIKRLYQEDYDRFKYTDDLK
jgi:hypothetical protein